MAKQPKKNDFVYDAFDLIKFAWDKRLILIIVSAVAFIISIIVSLTITPRFESQVTMFPAASVSISKNLVETNVVSSDTKDILTFGEDADAERLLQVLNSDQIRNHEIQKFDLMKHYRIDTSSKIKYAILDAKFKGNVKFSRTQYSSIKIDVLDEDPKMAAKIANDIAGYVDTVYFNIKQARATEAYKTVLEAFNNSTQNIEWLTDSLTKIRNLGVQDYKSQSEGLNTAYGTAVANGNQKAIKMIEDKLKIMAKYGGPYVELSDRLEWEIERNSMLKAKLAAAKVNKENTISNVFIVDKATPSERKATPHRSLIVLLTTISTFALTLLILLIVDNVKARI